MDIQEYFSRLNAESQKIFNQTVVEKASLGALHNLSSYIYEFAECLPDPQEREIMITVSSQLESATLNLTLGLYRQAFSSLRLAFEMGLAAIYFSVNKMELNECLDGRADIRWSSLVDVDNGVLSTRFAKAFLSECSEYVNGYRNDAVSIYRELSEYVHGNSETWVKSGLQLSFSRDLFELYVRCYKSVAIIILFAAVCRYTRLLDAEARESLQFIPDEFNHIAEIRALFGRS